MSGNMTRKEVAWSTWAILTVALLFAPAIPTSASHQAATTQAMILEYPTNAVDLVSPAVDYYDEHGQVWINPEGWIDSEVRMEGSDVIVGDFDLNQLPESFKAIFTWGHFSFWQTGDPNEMNGDIHLTLQTNNFSQAESYGQTVLDLLNRYTIVTWENTGTWGWDEYWGDQWVQLTTVQYRAHIDWPWFMDVMNDSIPRGYGGLAETVDISDANRLWFWAWMNHGDTDEVWHGIGAAWNTDAGSRTGEFNFSAKDLLHVNYLQKASHDDSLRISWYLPNVENVTTTPSSDLTGNWDIEIDYHPNLEEPWNLHHHYDVWMELYSFVDDFRVSFDYAFIPWDLQDAEEFNVIAAPYGYLGKQARFSNHSLVDLYEIPDVNITEILRVSLSMAPDYGSLGVSWHTSWLDIEFEDGTVTADRNTAATAIAEAYETALGGSFNCDNDTRVEWRDDHLGSGERYLVSYRGDKNGFFKTQIENAISNSSFYNNSQNLRQTGITDWTGYSENWEYNSWLDGYYSKHAAIRWSPLEPWIAPPTGKIFPTGIDDTYNMTATSLWNWNNISKSPDFDRLTVRLVAPIYMDNDSWDTVTNPDRDNGFGYDMWKWDGMPSDATLRVVEATMNVYTEEPWITNDEGTKIRKLEEFELIFNFTFLSDDTDICAPWSELGVLNGSEEIREHYQEWSDWKWNNTQELTVYAWDHPWDGFWWWGFYHDYWDNTTKEWIPRFGTSGVYNVSMDLFFSDLPVDDPAFHRSLPTFYNSTLNRWTSTWNTSNGKFADGEWTITTTTEDNDGNNATLSYQVVVDNYPDEDTSPPNVTIVPLEGVDSTNETTHEWNVSGRVRVQINITDDIDVFAAVFTVDFGGWILDADYEVYNESPHLFVYEFEWDSRNEVEDSWHFISVKAWDLDGHSTTITYSWFVDNRKIGNPPSMGIISPSSSGEEISGLYLLQVYVTDDLTPPEDLSVTVAVDDRLPMVMSYNASNDLFELLWDSSTVCDKSYTLTFQATDRDQNVHTEERTIDITTSNGILCVSGDPPTWKDFRGTSDRGELLNYTEQQIINEEYESHVKEISFEISVKDDLGIDSVQIRIYKVPNEAIDYFSQTIDEDIVKQNHNLAEGYPQSMTNEGATSDGYTRFSHVWNSENEADNLWIVEIAIADIDDPQHVVYVHLPVFTDNFEDQEPEIGAPGFEMVAVLFGLACSLGLRIWRKRTRVL